MILNRLKPSGDRKRGFYAEVPVNIEVEGTYHQVATFFDELGRMDRIVNVGEFDMQNPVVAEESIVLNTSVVATTFRFLSEAERGERRGEKEKEPEKEVIGLLTPVFRPRLLAVPFSQNYFLIKICFGVRVSLL